MDIYESFAEKAFAMRRSGVRSSSAPPIKSSDLGNYHQVAILAEGNQKCGRTRDYQSLFKSLGVVK